MRYLGLQKAPKLSREDEDLVPALYDQINKLKGQNSMLLEKNKELLDSLEKKKRELAVSKKVLQSKRATTTKSAPMREIPLQSSEIDILPGPSKHGVIPLLPPPQDQNVPSNFPPPDANLLEIAKKYKARLAYPRRLTIILH
jgi:hypothetical protein